MNMELLCSLCVTPDLNEYKFLRNVSGEFNEIYEITVQYFNPELFMENISTDCSKESSVLCQNCWDHIQDFHDFQQTVMKARTSLEKLKANKIPVKIEKEDKISLNDNENEVLLHIKVEEEHVHCLVNVDNCDFNNRTITSSGDTNMHQSAFRINVGEFQVTTLFNDCGNEESTSLNQINRPNSPFHIKLEEEQVMPFSNFNNCSGTEVHSIEPFVSEEQNHVGENSKIDCSSDEDEEIPLHKLKQSMKSEFSDKMYTDVHSKKNDLDKQKKSESHEVRKSKILPKGSIKLDSADERDDVLQRYEFDKYIAEWKPQLECVICGEAFPRYHLLKVHFKVHHNTKVYIMCCAQKFFLRRHLVEHIRLHVNPETHKCEICGKLNGTKEGLIRHKKIFHKQSKKFKCSECPKIFKQKSGLNYHLLTHSMGFKCNQCDRAYAMESQLKKHIITRHTKKTICDQCGKSFCGISALKNHWKTHFRTKKTKFPCEECNVEYTSSIALRRHKATYHNDGSTVYVCSLCGKVSSTEEALRYHKKYVHEKEKDFKCPQCDRAFKRPQYLHQHIATHTGETLFQCSQCPQSFQSYFKYRVHCKRHHPEEWEQSRKKRLEKHKIDYERVTNQVFL